MKKILLLLLLNTFGFSLFTSCSDDNEEDSLEKGKAQIYVNCWDNIYEQQGFTGGTAYFFKVPENQSSIQHTVGSGYIILEDGTKVTSSYEGKVMDSRGLFVVDAPANYIVVFAPFIYKGYTYGYKEVREDDTDPWIRLSFSDKNQSSQ